MCARPVLAPSPPGSHHLMIVIWARHGQNPANLTRTFSYRVVDPDLTELGGQQARDLGARLRRDGELPVAVLCSPMKRARQTAEIVADELGMEVAEQIEGLRERNVGDLDGRNDDEGWRAHDAVLTAWDAGEMDARFPRGESLRELVERIRAAFEHIARAYPQGTVVVCAHGGNLRSAARELTGYACAGDLRNGETVRLAVGDGPGADVRVQVLRWGD